MKVFISVDIEGITGVSHWDETLQTSPFVEQMTREVAAACEGANLAGATEILVKDAHSTGRNIDPKCLPHNVKVLRNWSMGPLSMMEGINESFDACMFVGYHNGAFMPGNPLAHTFTNTKIQYLKINGRYMSEFEINAMTAHYYNVPVVFVSGDQALCHDAKELLSHIETVAVMEGIGDASISIHPSVAIERIIEGSEKAMKHDLKMLEKPIPEYFECEIQFKEAKLAHRGSYYPGVKQKDNKTITFESHDYMDLLKMIMFTKI
ncbi:amino acid amidase [Acidaminobacter sp. JC074]|uniref:M55 family metallopeptidase n=1 Tax=Acidaminobacter sp. JC074 TaxID=2530199 RepID=UPI001F0F0B12|nr:M55 family metallopeptidase [Acidaminobacter sp. JC074]MCH4885942.1 amino acid amidase [Acidaminobacter sp. JC074]